MTRRKTAAGPKQSHILKATPNLADPEILGFDDSGDLIFDLTGDTIGDELDIYQDIPKDTDTVELELAQTLFALPDQSVGKLVLQFKLDKRLQKEVSRVLKPTGTVIEGESRAKYELPVTKPRDSRKKRRVALLDEPKSEEPKT